MNIFFKAICSSLLLLTSLFSYGQNVGSVGVLTYTASSYTPPATNLSAHYDCSVSSSVHVTTGVSTWDDLTGNGNHLTQATAGSQPVYSGTGTSSIITFGGKYLKTATFTLNSPCTLYLVIKTTTNTVNDTWCSGFSGTSINIQENSPYPSMFFGAAGPTSVTGLTTGTFQVISAVYNSSTSSITCNTNAMTLFTGAPSLNNPSGFTIGSNASGTQTSSIVLKEIYLYNTAHSTTTMSATQSAIIGYLRTKWGI